MKHMEIFEQAMCCPTGLCGPSIDPELLRVSTVLDTLKQHGIDVGRYNLTSAPLKFVQTKAVTDFLQYHGPEDLPLILVDGAVQFAGRYPTNDEFASLIGFDPAILEARSGRWGQLLLRRQRRRNSFLLLWRYTG